MEAIDAASVVLSDAHAEPFTAGLCLHLHIFCVF